MYVLQGWRLWNALLSVTFLAGLLYTGAIAWAETKSDKVFHAVITDAQGTETEVKNIVFYWEEKVSETSIALHELRHVPVKSGAATINVKFEKIKQIEAKPGTDKGSPVFIITLTTGKTGEFPLAIPGQFKGESDFGEVLMPINSLKKIVFK
jgi:hypothetical protein